jgi:hypothetical protein
VALEIIGSGFGRTGTTSLKRAVERLGFGPCHHMEEVLGHPEQVPYWQAVVAGNAPPWDVVFDGYRSQVDWPGAHVWRELAGAYPAANVIHTVRPEDAWWTSFSNTIGKMLAGYKDRPAPPHIPAMMQAMEIAILQQTFHCAADDREGVLAAYRRRAVDVREAIAPERLLLFDVSQGWAPLCTFLDVPVPEEPFPRVNSTEEFWQASGPQPSS